MIELPNDIDLSLINGFLDGIKPDPTMTVSEWADNNRILPDTSAEPGKFKTSRTPYAKEIMDKLSVIDPTQKIIVKKGSQLGFTEIGNNWVGYTIDMAPASFMYIQPTDAQMKKTSKQRIEKMIDSTPTLREKIGKPRGKDTVDNLLYKEFPGGFLSMVGANSPVGLSSIPAKNIYCDEVDAYPESVEQEGSVVDLADTRSSTFGNRRKMFLTSTPRKQKKISQITKEFEKTGQRYFHVPCPECGEYQVLQFENLKYTPGKYHDVKYECGNCKTLIPEHKKTQMLEQGKWVPRFPNREDGYTFGYHINSMNSPYGMYSWSKMAKEFDEAQGDIPKLIVFTNTKLAECYEPEAENKPKWENLYERSEDYEPNKPFASVVFITAGVDVQGDRLEIEIVGWIKGKGSQSIDYRVILGNTLLDEVWDELTKILNEKWIREDNKELPIRMMAIDTGFNTQKVYEFAQKHSVVKLIPVKGRSTIQTFLERPKAVDIAKAGKTIGKVKVWGVGVSMIKSEIYGFLRLTINHETGEIPSGYCHFPQREPIYFKGLISEELKEVTNKKGFEEYIWVKKVKRNEPLDCRVYARAAAAAVGMDRWNDERWNRESDVYDEYVQQELNNQQTKQSKPLKRQSDYWK